MREESFSQIIETKHGRLCLKLTQNLQRNVNKIARLQNHIKFLRRCRDNRVIPKGLRIKLPKDGQNIAGINRNREKMEQSRLSKNTQLFKKELAFVQQKTAEIKNKLKNTFEDKDYEWLEIIIEKSKQMEHKKVQERQIRKYSALIEEKQNEKESDRKGREDTENMRKEKLKNEVVDLTKDGIDNDMKAYLRLGPDFCEAPNRIPVEKMITITEGMCNTIEKKGQEENKEEVLIKREVNELRDEVSKLLISTAKNKVYSNLTREEQRGKKKIQQDKEKVFLPADKGRIMVTMDRYEAHNLEQSYETKMKEVLKDLKATPSIRGGKDWDLTKVVSRKGTEIIDKIVERGELSENFKKWLRPKDCHAPRLTGYPKIHKVDIPLRGVVSFVCSPYDKVSKHLVPILKTLQGRSGLYIKNSRDLKEIVKHWRIERNETLVSYDVKNLYPSVPIKEALDLVEILLMRKVDLKEKTPLSVRSIMELLKWIFQDTYCEYAGKHYVLDSGPIGLGVTGEVAIIYMEEFQIKVMKTSPIEINSWPWYVDDSETKCKKEDTETIINYLNSIDSDNIKFTKEEPVEDTIAVLDLKQIINRHTKRLEFTVNYKSTHTNINVKERSNHPESMKQAIIKGFTERAKALCDDEYLEEELKNIEDVFVANDFKRETVIQYMNSEKREKSTDEENTEERGVVVVPYLKCFSDKFKRIAKKHLFKTAFKPGRKVKEVRKLCQEPLGQKTKDAVYKIPCGCGNSSYIGETWRNLETRIYEHKMGVRMTHQDMEEGRPEAAEKRMNKEDGGLPRHGIECTSDVDWENVSILAIERDTEERKMREAIESEREKYGGGKILNHFRQIPHWDLTLDKFFQMEKDRGGGR